MCSGEKRARDERGTAAALRSSRDVCAPRAGFNKVARDPHGVQSGAALPVDGRTGHTQRKPGGQG